MADFARYLSNLSEGLKTLSQDINTIVERKKSEEKSQGRDKITGLTGDTRDKKTGNFNSLMSTNRFVSDSEKNGKQDKDVKNILDAVDKLFGG